MEEYYEALTDLDDLGVFGPNPYFGEMYYEDIIGGEE